MQPTSRCETALPSVIKLEKPASALCWQRVGLSMWLRSVRVHAHACIQVLWPGGGGNHMQTTAHTLGWCPSSRDNPGTGNLLRPNKRFQPSVNSEITVCISWCYTMITIVIWFKCVPTEGTGQREVTPFTYYNLCVRKMEGEKNSNTMCHLGVLW